MRPRQNACSFVAAAAWHGPTTQQKHRRAVGAGLGPKGSGSKGEDQWLSESGGKVRSFLRNEAWLSRPGWDAPDRTDELSCRASSCGRPACRDACGKRSGSVGVRHVWVASRYCGNTNCRYPECSPLAPPTPQSPGRCVCGGRVEAVRMRAERKREQKLGLSARAPRPLGSQYPCALAGEHLVKGGGGEWQIDQVGLRVPKQPPPPAKKTRWRRLVIP